MNAQIQGLLSYTQAIIDRFPDATLVLDADKKILVHNNLFLKLFHLTHAEVSELSFLEIVNNKWNMKILSEKLSITDPTGEDFYVQHHFNGIGLLNLQISIERITAETESLYVLILKFREK